MGDDIVSVDVYQPPFNNESELEGQIGYGERQGAQFHTEQGIQLGVWHPDDRNRWEFVVGNQDIVVSGQLHYKKQKYGNRTPEQVINEIAKLVATNIAKGPTAPAQYQYNAPYKNTPNPCEVLSADIFQQTYGEPASGIVEGIYSAQEERLKPDNGPVMKTARQAALRNQSPSI